MAIYQYNINLIPRQSIIEKCGFIPETLPIDNEAWSKHWNSKSLEADYDFEDALNYPWWSKRKTDFKSIEPFIDSYTKPIEWSKHYAGIKTYGDNDTNDMSIDIADDGCIENFSCRLDLRKFDDIFITNILKIAKQLDCLLMDRKGNLFEPYGEALWESIQQSNSYKFVDNPTDFLEKLSSGQIKPE